MPSQWKGFRVRLKLGEASYLIVAERRDKASLTFDGDPVEKDIPIMAGGEHEVVVAFV